MFCDAFTCLLCCVERNSSASNCASASIRLLLTWSIKVCNLLWKPTHSPALIWSMALTSACNFASSSFNVSLVVCGFSAMVATWSLSTFLKSACNLPLMLRAPSPSANICPASFFMAVFSIMKCSGAILPSLPGVFFVTACLVGDALGAVLLCISFPESSLCWCVGGGGSLKNQTGHAEHKHATIRTAWNQNPRNVEHN